MKKGIWDAAKTTAVALIKNFDVNYQEDGATALYYACRSGDSHIVSHLLEDDRIDVNLGSPPLVAACESRHINIVTLLLADKRVDVNHTGVYDATPLYSACCSNNQELVTLILTAPGIEVNKLDDDMSTPFLFVCRKGFHDIVSLLLADQRTDPNIPNSAGLSPFLAACNNSCWEVVSLFLADPRVDVNAGMTDGCTAFYIACQDGNLALVRLLMNHPRIDIRQVGKGEMSPLFIACQNNHGNVVRLLLTKVKDVNRPSISGRTPFTRACEHGHDEIVKMLLDDPRVDTTTTDDTGCSALWTTSRNGHLSTIQLILASDREVDIHARTMKGLSIWENTTAREITHIKMVHPNPLDPQIEQDRKKQNYSLILNLLIAYEKDPVATRHWVRELPSMRAEYITGTFAVVVFLCDDLLQLNPNPDLIVTTTTPAIRFFLMMSRLPMEIQMMICNRLYSCPSDNILTQYSEPAFKKLATQLSQIM